jgi:hypothetical protein
MCLLAATAVALFGCGKNVTRENLPGAYSADYGFAKEELELKNNGEFEQRIKVLSRQELSTANGTWRFDQQACDIYFSKEFLVVADGLGNLKPDFDSKERKAIGILPVRRWFGRIQIGLAPAQPYRKQK